MTEEEEKSCQQNQNENIDWHKSPQSESHPNPIIDEQRDNQEKVFDISALRSEETLEFKREAKTRNGTYFYMKRHFIML